MKRIEAIIRESRVEYVREALEVNGVHGMTITPAHGSGSQAGPTATYRGAEHRTDLLPRVKLDIVVHDAHADRVVDTIYRTAHTGEIGDGRILITNLEEVIHIRTGETEGARNAEHSRQPSHRLPKEIMPRAASAMYHQTV